MPDWLWKKLLTGPKVSKKTVIAKGGSLITQETVENETPGLVPVLARLSTLDRDVAEAWFCHPSVVHIFALPKEGGFCGYRNIQMMISYLQGSKAYGYEKFPGRLPTVPALQDSIEHAWNMGINTIARQQTGGIKGSRKYIGTPEVCVFVFSHHSMNADGHRSLLCSKVSPFPVSRNHATAAKRAQRPTRCSLTP